MIVYTKRAWLKPNGHWGWKVEKQQTVIAHGECTTRAAAVKAGRQASRLDATRTVKLIPLYDIQRVFVKEK